MKMTLLEIVQDVLNDLDSDEVNSISDTVEAVQISAIAKSVYYELMTRYDWPHLEQIITLDSLNDSTRPNYLKLPVAVYDIEDIKYDIRKANETRTKMTSITYKDKKDFIVEANSLDDSSSNVTVVEDIDGTSYNIRNDLAPTYWTTFDDEHIVFNSYDSAVDGSYLISSKSQAFAVVEPAWSMSDSFTPDLPAKAFPLLVEEIKSTASAKLRQIIDDKSEQKSKIQQRRQTQVRGRSVGGIKYPSYGRKAGRGTTQTHLLSKQ